MLSRFVGMDWVGDGPGPRSRPGRLYSGGASSPIYKGTSGGGAACTFAQGQVVFFNLPACS